MGKKLDLVGKKFSRLTVLYETSRSKSNQRRYHCKCDCGNEGDFFASAIHNGHTKSCGCLAKEVTHNLMFKDITGNRYGNLTVIKLDHMDKMAFWECKCDCGNTTIVRVALLINGNTRSCGCIRESAVSKAIVKRLENETFGRLTVMHESGRDNNKNVIWHCKCSCGKEVDVRGTHLIRGKILSCGCYAKDINRERLALQMLANRSYPQWFIDEIYYEKDKKRAIIKSLLSTERIYFNCNEHGKYKQRISDHLTMGTGLSSCGCPKCANSIGARGSKEENSVMEYINSLSDTVTSEKCKLLIDDTSNRKKEIDIYIKELGLGIEYNGSVYHSSINGVYNNKEKLYHQQKFLQAEKQGIHLINIFDVDWATNQDKIKQYIHDLVVPCTKIFARKCILKVVSKEDAVEFENKYHIQGSNSRMTQINYGLYYNEELLAVMTFGKLRMSKTEEGQYELHRYCVKAGYTIVGGANKLLKAFERDYNPKYLRSYSDNDYFTGGIYPRLGFEFKGNSTPRYYWFYRGKEIKREKCQLKYLKVDYPELLQEAYSTKSSNKEIYVMSKLGARQVYRSGTKKWEKSY